MNEQFNKTVAYGQILLLLLWEAAGVAYFGWSPIGIALVWGLSIFTLNLSVATALRTFIKLTRVPAPEDVPADALPDITEEDGVA